MKYLWFVCLLGSLSLPTHAESIKELASIAGVRSNPLLGYGLVVGLEGSGDKSGSSPFTTQSLGNMLNQLGIQIPTGTKLDPKNIAAVSLTATLYPFARRGQTLDVTVSSIGDAKSLKGGTLLMSTLKGADGQVYALAQGNVVVGTSDTKSNQHLSVGRIPNGATVEKEVSMALNDQHNLTLQLKEPDFTTASRIVTAINRTMGTNTARALDGASISITAPMDSNQRVTFLSTLENINVDPAESVATVIVNARTGSIVMNRQVMLEPCSISHGSLTVTIGNKPNTSGVFNVEKSTNLSQVVSALNALGAKPSDLVSILQAMKAAGALKADLQIL